MKNRALILIFMAIPALGAVREPRMSMGRQPDSTEKRVAEIREGERRLIPLDVSVLAEQAYRLKDPIEVTILVTNLFDNPLVLNQRMLVNHPLLKGEVHFKITGPDGRTAELKRLVTPMSVRDEDFVVVKKGHSIQRTVDLSDLYTLGQKGVYRVQAAYHNDVDQPLGSMHAWKGLVQSEPFEIRIN
jgi:hypothetical protein